MRDLDARAILANDFLVVYGDIVSNLPLESALAAHRERRTKDKNAIMTMVLREAGIHHRTKSEHVNPVFVIDPSKDRCVHYEQMRPRQSDRYVNLDPDILKEHDEIEVRQDLIDCGIDICTPDVLALWSDNFDYEYPRKGFLHSVLKDYELNGKTIHTHIVTDHYAARVKNLRAYGAVTKDVVGRWAYPICPDTNLVRDQTFRLVKGNIYKEYGVMLARSCVIGSKTVIGRSSSVDERSIVKNSVIGRNCIIGRNCKIDGAYLWDNVRIGDGTIVKDAIIAHDTSIGKRCKIMPGSLLSFGLQIKDNTTVPENSRITCLNPDGKWEPSDKTTESKQTAAGLGGKGFTYAPKDDEEDEEHLGLGPNSFYNMAERSHSAESISTIHSDDGDDDSDDWTEGPSHGGRDRSASFGSIGSVVSDDSQVDTRAAVDFHHDAAASIYDSLQKGDESANMQLELTALRMSADASPGQVRRAVVAAFMKRIAGLVEEGQTPAQAVRATVPPHKMLLERTVFDRGEAHAAKPDQVELLLLVQQDLCHRRDGEHVMLYASNELIMGDVVDAEGFEQWWADPRSEGSEEMKKVRSLMGQFMDAILESDSEEEKDEEEDEEEEDESSEDGDDDDEDDDDDE